jgi:hypothetical protein
MGTQFVPYFIRLFKSTSRGHPEQLIHAVAAADEVIFSVDQGKCTEILQGIFNPFSLP